jgi:hypothetical protein
MLRLAAAFPLAACSGCVSVEMLQAAEAVALSLQGVRPANQPRARIAQYLDWVRARPDWPERWRAFEGELVADRSAGVNAGRAP